MSKMVADISMSLDGFVTGPNPDSGEGLGEGGEELYDWVVGSDDEVDADVLRAATEATQALSAAGKKDVCVTYRVWSRV